MFSSITVTQIKTRWKPGQHHSRLIINCVEVGPAVIGVGVDRWGESDFPKEELYSEFEQGFRTEQKCEVKKYS